MKNWVSHYESDLTLLFRQTLNTCRHCLHLPRAFYGTAKVYRTSVQIFSSHVCGRVWYSQARPVAGNKADNRLVEHGAPVDMAGSHG
jgi:hypothetical protein